VKPARARRIPDEAAKADAYAGFVRNLEFAWKRVRAEALRKRVFDRDAQLLFDVRRASFGGLMCRVSFSGS
jgi:hypothetical protein